MAKARLSDREAKNILLKWPERSKALWQTPSKTGYWMRAQPKPANVSISHPRLHTPRASLFSTQPDGLWVYFHDQDCCDVICVEVCGKIQNLYDKRSRYIPASQSVVMSCPLAWLLKDVRLPNGGKKPLWVASRSIRTKPKCDLVLPIRYLRVLYAIANDDYSKWKSNHSPTGYEFFIKHSSLDTQNSQTTRSFLKRMCISQHFLTMK